MTRASHIESCVVVGAGAAGISAVTWLAHYKIPYRWFSSEAELGGMLARVRNSIHNFPPGRYCDGPTLVSAFQDHLRAGGSGGPEAATVAGIRTYEQGCVVLLGDLDPVDARVVILATGTRYRTLGVPGEAEGLGRYVSQSAMTDGQRFAGSTVAVVGGGDAAFENALILADKGCKVHVLLRSPQPRAATRFQQAVNAHPDISIHPIPTTVQRFEAREQGCTLHLDVQGRHELLDVACVFVRIGVDAVFPTILPQLETHHGYLSVDSHRRTSHPRILAAGDVTAPTFRSVATAVADGAAAARTASQILGLRPGDGDLG